MVYKLIDNEQEEKEFQQKIDEGKITPETFGLQPSNDFDYYANKVIFDEVPEKAAQWSKKGGIDVMEAGRMLADEFNGSYNNVRTYKQQQDDFLQKHPLMKKWNESTEERLNNQKQLKAERNKRVNNGTASILDRVGASLDRCCATSANAQIKAAQQHENTQKPNKDNPNYRYDPVPTRTGRVIYNEIDLRKQIGFLEGLGNSVLSGKAFPFVGGMIEGKYNNHIEKIRDKINNGEEITQQDLDLFNRYKDREYEKQIRGYSIKGSIGESWMPSLIAFGSEMMLGGLAVKALGLEGAGVQVGVNAGKKLVRAGVNKSIAKGTAYATGQLAEGAMSAAVGSIVNAPNRLWATLSERRLNDKMKITDRGTVIFTEATETPTKAFFKSLGSVYVSYFSEHMGGLIGAGLIKPVSSLAEKAVVNPITKGAVSAGAKQFENVLKNCPELEKLVQKTTPIFAKAYEKLNNLPIKGESVEWLKSQVKFDGFLEEMGEEVLEDILNLSIGTDGEERTLENYVKKIVKTPEEWAVLAGVIALQGGSISIAGNLLGDAMQRSGVPEEKIIEVLENSTETEKLDLLSGLIDDNTIQIKDLTDEQKIKQEEIKNATFDKLVNVGVKEEEANNLSLIMSSFFRNFGTSSKKATDVFSKLFEKLDIQYNVPVNEQNNTHFQSAMIADITPSQKVNIIDLTEQFPDSQNLSKKDLSQHIKDLIGTQPLRSKDKKALLSFVKRSKRTGVKDIYIPDHIANSSKVETAHKGERNTAVSNIVDLIQNSVLIDVEPNNKKQTKPNVDNYLRFYTPVQIGNNIFTVRIVAENNKKKDIFNILNADVYDVIIDKKMTASVLIPANKQRNLMKPSSNNSINNDEGDFNPDTLTIEEMLKGVVGADGKTYFQSAYHGTPHKFDDFSLENIGTGEGAQAHGWGLYFSKNKEIAEGYRNNLSSPSYFYNNKKLKSDSVEFVALDSIYRIKAFEGTTLEDATKRALAYHIDEQKKENKLASLSNKIFRSNVIKFIKKIDISKAEMKYGQLFEVDIPENDILLDEDKTFNEQSKNIQETLKAILLDNKFSEYWDDFDSAEEFAESEITDWQQGFTGGNIYDRLARLLGSDKDASLLLNKYGIKGITYEGYEDGRCYVIFDDKAIDVIKTYYQTEEKLIAGFTQQEVMDKLTQLYEEIADTKDFELEKKLMTNINILNDVLAASENAIKFGNDEAKTELYLNAYYVMNNQEIPEEYSEADSQRTLYDIKKLHDERREQEESKYYGYFKEDAHKSVITIMQGHNSSTALHELGHWFLSGLNELAKVDNNAKKKLEAVNKWLGYSGEYTIAQHEKFARSFEAYLYKGKAPNNSLRKVFEDFKEWLKSVYAHVLNIPEADISEEVQELFDGIFGGEEYYEEKKQANELLKKVKSLSKKEKVKKVSVRKDNELDEVEKRHKEISYDILSTATGKSKNYLKTIFETGSDKKSFSQKRENIETLLDSVEDRIKEQGGMLDEWKEFYSDYDNADTNADYKLAQQALNTIINKSYRNSARFLDDELTQRAEYFEQAIDEADRQYKLLLSSFKKGNRNVALSAIYDWLDDLDSEIKKDYEDRLNFDIAMIERNENIDKFDKAKRKIIAKAMELENKYSINQNEKYKEIVKEIMKDLDFLQPADKAKLTVNILDVPTLDFLMSSLDNILDIAKTMEDVNYRRKLERNIHKELQQTKNVKKNGRSVGKYNYKTNKIFEELRELDRKTPEEANNLRLDAKKFSTAEDNGLSFSQKLYNKFLSYKAGGLTFANTELMKELYDDIVKIKLIGKSAKSEIELQEKLSEEKDIEELINIVEKKKDSNIVLKAYINGIGNLESTLNAVFNKDIKDRYGAEILYAETQAQAWQHEQKQKFERAVAKIYNLLQWCWDKKIIEYLGEKHTYNEIRRKYNAEGELIKTRNISRTLSKMDIISAYIYSKNEILEKRLKNQFGETTLEAMFDELSLEDVKLAELLMNTAQSFYPQVNKSFIRKYGLDLPKVSCYFPSTPERGSEVDLFNEYSSKSLGNGFTKGRAKSETLPMDFHNPIATLYSHIDGVSKFVFMSESLDKANLRFKDTDLRRVITNKYGEDVYRTLEQILANITYKKEAAVFNGMNKIIDNMVGNWIQANVAIKPIVGLKQLLSANNYAIDMPYMTWQAGFLKALEHPKATVDYMMNIPYIKARFEGSFSNEFLKQTIENSAFAMSKKLKDCCNFFIKTGDIGAIIFGGKPYIDYLIKEKGMSEQEAIKQFILSTNRSQQSSAISSLSNFQVAMTRNPIGKLFIAFKNSPQQYIRMCGDAIVSAANGDMTKTQCAKMLFQYGYLQPFLYAMATSGSLLRFLFTGDDDDLLKDAAISIFNLGSDALPIIGDFYKYTIENLLFNAGVLPQKTPLLGDIQQEINKLSKNDIELSDFLESIGYLVLHVGLGYNSKAIGSMASGAIDMFNDEPAQGAMKVFGYTEKRAKHITGND